MSGMGGSSNDYATIIGVQLTEKLYFGLGSPPFGIDLHIRMAAQVAKEGTNIVRSKW
jgi:hypothetical protein